MKLIAFSRWLESTPLSQSIQTTPWAIPGIQVLHILCLATLFALALNLCLRVAGRGLALESSRSLAARPGSLPQSVIGLPRFDQSVARAVPHPPALTMAAMTASTT